MDTTFDVPRAISSSALPLGLHLALREFRAWGFWASLCWGLFALASGVLASVICIVIWTLTHQLQSPNDQDAAFNTTVGIVEAVIPLIVLGMAVRMRRFSLRYYFALKGIPLRHLLFGAACLAVLILTFAALEPLLGIDGGSKSVEEGYRVAKLAKVLPLLWFATIVVAPITEELLFRGFLHRGWARTWIGLPGTIFLTSVLWAALHQQYNWLGILCIFLMGLIFGWVRHRSGSTSLVIVLHAFNNLIAMIWVTLQVEWL
jgi:membrane protease YdiL (CAAX protease family)